SRTIRKQLVKKSLDLFEELEKERPDDYATFWSSFGPAIKAGMATDFEHQTRLASLTRFESTATEAGTTTSLGAYVARMKEGQPAIYWIFGESRRALEGSPHLEAIRGKGFEVLFMTDPVDEYAIDSLRKFRDKPFVSVMRAELDLDEGKAEREAREAALK